MASVLHADDLIRYYPPGSMTYEVGTIGSTLSYSTSPFDWYVDSVGGLDTNDGKSPGTAFQTLGGLLGETLTPNQRIGLTGTFRETLTVPDNNLTFAGYGGGATISAVPVLSGIPEETGGLFASGFEDETDAFNVDFSGTNLAGGNTAVVTTTTARTGSKSMLFTFAGVTYASYVQKILGGAITECYARTWIKLDQGFSMSATGNQVYLFEGYDTSPAGYPWLVGINSVNRKEQSWLYAAFQRAGGFTFVNIGVLVTPNVWHSLEVHWKAHATTGGLGVYWDGVLVGSDFTRDTSAYTAEMMMLGGFGGVQSPAAGSKVYYDDVKVSATGPLGDSVTRLDYAVDLNSKSGLVFRDLDLQNAGVSNFKSGGATFTASNTRSMYVEPWTAPNDSTLPFTMTELHDIGYAIGASAIAPDGTMYLCTADSKVQKSTNGGASWTTVKTFPDALAQCNALLVDSRGYIHASPTSGASSTGIWTSTDSGANWTRNLDTSANAQPGGMWGITEDGEGRVYAGYYHSHAATADAKIFRTTNGIDWTQVWDGVNETKNARHVHNVVADPITGYVYALIGDGGSWESPITIRSTDNGTNWTRILNSIPQNVGAVVTPTARIFGTDVPNSRASLYRTTDDSAFTEVLSVPRAMDCLWIRRDQDTGHLFAGFGGATTTTGQAGVWRSKDDGLTWEQVLALPITAAADGTSYASNIVGGKIILSQVSGGVAVGGGVYSVR